MGNLRINTNLLEDIGNVTHYKGKPFTGTLYALRGELKTLEDWEPQPDEGTDEKYIYYEFEMKDGLKNGKYIQNYSWESGGEGSGVGDHTAIGTVREKDEWLTISLKEYSRKPILECQCNYKNDELDGEAIYYHINGNIKMVENYRKGLLLQKDGIIIRSKTETIKSEKKNLVDKNKEFKSFIKNLKKHIDDEDVSILFHPERWDVSEKMESDGEWNGKYYTVYANVSLKGVEMCYDNSLKDLIKEIGSKKNIDEINAKEIEGNLYNNGDSGGNTDIEKIKWETPLTKEEEKELEEYGGGYQLYDDGDWMSEGFVYDTGNIYRIEVTVGDNKYTLERND